MESCQGLLLLWNTSRITSNKNQLLCTFPSVVPLHYALWRLCLITRHTLLTRQDHFFLFMSGEPVTHRFISQQLCKLVSFIGLNPKLYKGHSFRIKAATDAASLRFSENYIQKLGRWRSNAVRRYIRISFIWYIIFNIYYNPTRVQHLAAQIVGNTGPF